LGLEGNKTAVSTTKIAGEAINSGRNLTVVALTTKNRRDCTVDQRFPSNRHRPPSIRNANEFKSTQRAKNVKHLPVFLRIQERRNISMNF
jgi:hypothetical protein